MRPKGEPSDRVGEEVEVWGPLPEWEAPDFGDWNIDLPEWEAPEDWSIDLPEWDTEPEPTKEEATSINITLQKLKP
jgi:hypothetical protein